MRTVPVSKLDESINSFLNMNLHEICVSSYTFEVFDSVDFLITSRTEMIRKSKESDCELKKPFLRPENGRPHAKGSRMK